MDRKKQEKWEPGRSYIRKILKAFRGSLHSGVSPFDETIRVVLL